MSADTRPCPVCASAMKRHEASSLRWRWVWICTGDAIPEGDPPCTWEEHEGHLPPRS